MNPYMQSILLGIVEGLTEFLPVSSTAHLRIAEALMKIPLDDAYWKMYTIVIQLGAIGALVLLFLGRIVGFIRTFPKGENGTRTWLTHPISLTLIAFAVTSVPSLLLHKWSDKHLGSLAVIAWAMLIGGIVMWAVSYTHLDVYKRQSMGCAASSPSTRATLCDSLTLKRCIPAIWRTPEYANDAKSDIAR